MAFKTIYGNHALVPGMYVTTVGGFTLYSSKNCDTNCPCHSNDVYRCVNRLIHFGSGTHAIYRGHPNLPGDCPQDVGTGLYFGHADLEIKGTIYNGWVAISLSGPLIQLAASAEMEESAEMKENPAMGEDPCAP